MVGTFKTRRMLFTGEPVPAAEFHRLGAVEEVVPHDRLLPAARELAAAIAAKSPIGVRLAKESLNRSEDLPLKEGYRIEQDYTGRVTGFRDSGIARESYRSRQVPEWTWS
jgi:enoyl-CoA hydratase